MLFQVEFYTNISLNNRNQSYTDGYFRRPYSAFNWLIAFLASQEQPSFSLTNERLTKKVKSIHFKAVIEFRIALKDCFKQNCFHPSCFICFVRSNQRQSLYCSNSISLASGRQAQLNYRWVHFGTQDLSNGEKRRRLLLAPLRVLGSIGFFRKALWPFCSLWSWHLLEYSANIQCSFGCSHNPGATYFKKRHYA